MAHRAQVWWTRVYASCVSTCKKQVFIASVAPLFEWLQGVSDRVTRMQVIAFLSQEIPSSEMESPKLNYSLCLRSLSHHGKTATFVFLTVLWEFNRYSKWKHDNDYVVTVLCLMSGRFRHKKTQMFQCTTSVYYLINHKWLDDQTWILHCSFFQLCSLFFLLLSCKWFRQLQHISAKRSSAPTPACCALTWQSDTNSLLQVWNLTADGQVHTETLGVKLNGSTPDL